MSRPDSDLPAQRFTFGYHLNTWDLGGLPLQDGLETIRRNDIPFVEALARDEISNDFARRYMQTGPQPLQVHPGDVAFLRRLAVLSMASDAGLRVSSLYCNREFVNPLTWPAELDTLVGIARVLHGFAAPGLVLGGGPPARPGSDHEPALYTRFARALRAVGQRVAELGMWTAYHPHIDTFIETRDQLDRLMTELDSGPAGLCIDPAHLVLSGSDPVAAVRDYAAVIRYMHFKDVLDPAKVSGPARYTAFRELGGGVVDLRGVAAELRRAGYDGLVIIELDTTEHDPEQSVQTSLNYLRTELGLAITPP